MQERKNALAFRYEDLPGGGRVRITTSDANATNAVHEFLRYQIREHATGDPLTVKLNLKLELGASSTRPTLLRFTVAILLSAVVITLSENTVPPVSAFSPFTITVPEADNSPDGAFAAGDAKTTIE